MIKLGITCPNHQRPQILSLWCSSITRLRRETGFNIPAVVVSGVEDEIICKSHDIDHVTQENNPVTAKFNTGVSYLKGKVDYVLVSGSDDIISTDTFLKIYEKAKEGYDLIGIDRVYFFATDGPYKGQLGLFQGTRILGVAKTISAGVLNVVSWRPWNINKNWGMDAIAQNNIKKHVSTIHVVPEAMVVDVKSSKNLNSSNFWLGQKIKTREDTEKFYGILGDEEKQILKQIMK